VSTKTLACLARSLRDIPDLLSSEAKLLIESMLSGVEKKEDPELEVLDARDDGREMGDGRWASIFRGYEGTEGNWARMGVIHVGSRTSSAIIANNSFSSRESSSISCCANVLLGDGLEMFNAAGLDLMAAALFLAAISSDQTVKNFPLLPESQWPNRTDMDPGSTNKSNSMFPRSLIHSDQSTRATEHAPWIARGGAVTGERVRHRRPEPRRGSDGTQVGAY